MIDSQFLKEKKILFTSFSFALFGGAELNPVELAEQLTKYGAIPYFFSYDIDGPLNEYIEKKFKTKVLTDSVYYLAEGDTDEQLRNTQMNINDYDYIWIGGNTLPISLIKQINTTDKLPKFIFIHMSQLIAYPLDAPLMPDFERKIASRILSISKKTTTDNIQRILGREVRVEGWSNPTPAEFRLLVERKGILRRVAVISSSHPSEELIESIKLITENNVKVDLIGAFNDNTQVVDAALYDRYDLIIGIGKNVQYSLVSGVPVYIYGRFGGGGYLSEENYKKNEELNFSGRGFTKKKSSEIAKEILSGYKSGLDFHNQNRKVMIDKYSIDEKAKKLFIDLEREKPKRVNFSDEQINWMVSMQINLMQRLYASSIVRSQNVRIGKLELQVENLEKKVLDMKRSKSWKLTAPLRRFVGLITRRK